MTYSASRPNYRPARFDPEPDAALLASITVFLSAHPAMGKATLDCQDGRDHA
jgi:hypothetical protein